MTTNRKRVLVCAASCSDAETALTIAEQLARLWGIDLGGVFLQESAVLESASLPSQRIVTATGALMDRPDPQRLRHILDREARAFEAALSRFAERYSLHWRLEAGGGGTLQTLWQVARGWDLLLIGQRLSRAPAGPVLLIAPEGTGNPELSDLAQRLAEGLGTFVERLSPQGYTTEDRQALLDRINRTRAALVLTDAAQGSFHDERALRDLVEAARCPVLVSQAGVQQNRTTEPR
ncbi:hypothetical protein [Jhaorihella thermophila]|uniref:Universal stress protein family protein n=1 Tax=Jhaorihella thermophila TaxID=488547 RepID=A0A1H5ULT6_9RHOB|nr:hypothetical protein [Jhaorihella thermophila]SEF75388.1 hypothetical protein SAMN05421751_104114 [Jhaorihella thermophila]